MAELTQALYTSRQARWPFVVGGLGNGTENVEKLDRLTKIIARIALRRPLFSDFRQQVEP